MSHDPFFYVFEFSLLLAMKSPRLMILLAIAILYDIMMIIVFFRVWFVRIDFMLRFAIAIATLFLPILGFPVYLIVRKIYGVYNEKPKKGRKGGKGKKKVNEKDVKKAEENGNVAEESELKQIN